MFDSNNKYAIKKKVACITDIDPLKRDLNNENSKFNKCYPFEFNVDYKNSSINIMIFQKYTRMIITRMLDFLLKMKSMEKPLSMI